MNPVRVNGQIRASEVRVVDEQGKLVDVMPLAEALALAKAKGIDLVEIAPLEKLPVCCLIDFGMYRYRMARLSRQNKQ